MYNIDIMKLIYLKLKNFKSISSLEIEFDKRVNVQTIYGTNGAGKSTLLSVFTFLGKLFSLTSMQINNMIISEESKSFGVLNDQFPPLDPFRPYNQWTIYDEYSTISLEKDIIVEAIFLINEKEYKYHITIDKNDIIKREYLKKNNKTFFEIERSDENSFAEGILVFEKKYNFNEILATHYNLSSNGIKALNSISLVSLIRMMNNWIGFDDNVLNILSKFSSSFDRRLNRLSGIHPMMHHHRINNGNFVFYLRLRPGDELRNHPRLKAFMTRAQRFYDFIKDFDNTIKGYDVSIEEESPFRQNSKFYKEERNMMYRIELELIKTIDHKDIKIPFSKESDGTKNYPKLFKLYENIIDGKDSILTLDEIGLSLNETLLLKLYDKIFVAAKKNDRQVFLTSHNAILLSKLVKDKIKDDEQEKLLWNKSKWIMFKNDGKTIMNNLVGKNHRDNNHLKFILGEYNSIQK